MKQLAILKSFLIFSLFFGSVDLQATHIRGGQIFYKKISALTFQLTFVGYRDQQGVLFGQGVFDFGDGTLFGDDQDEVIPWEVQEDLGNGIERWEFTLVHTYPSSGIFVPSYTEDFRTASVQNISSSVETSFYVEAMILLDPLINNSSPQNYGSPDMLAIAGTRFISNLMMFDDEGDSLSYSLDSPQNGLESIVENYKLPSDLSFYNDWVGDEDPEYFIDPITGNLEWDVPTIPGFYSIVLKTNEWRMINGDPVKVGSTKIDYLIEVIDIPPAYNVSVPDPSCQSPDVDYSDQIVISNDQNDHLSIAIYTQLDAITFNGLTSDEWNGRSQVFSEDEILIDVQLPSEALQAGFHHIYVKVSGNVDFIQEPITTTAGFAVGVGCSEEDLIVLGTEEGTEAVSLAISKNGIQINSDRERSSSLLIHDVNGKRLLKSEILLIEGDNVVNFTFNPYQIYFILLDFKKGSITEKVLLTK